MSKDLVVINNFCELSKTSLKFKRDVTKNEWSKVFSGLKTIEGCVQFWIGDCLKYREQKWGMYDDVAEESGYDQKTLEDIKYVYYREYSHPEFTKKVHDLSRTVNHLCYQCGTCTGSCPSAPRSSYRIRYFMRRQVLGLDDEILTDPDLWLCTTCYSCTDRCSRDIAPTDVIMAMRNLAFKRDIIPVNFLKTVQAIYSSGHGVPNNDVNRAAREKIGLTRDPPTTHMYLEYIKGIQKILDHYKLKANADRIVKEREG